jgi:4-hydroxybenzoate polyprenyltransferase/beta-phosphoglucomutase-like phosphatase (HAD superfamily)
VTDPAQALDVPPARALPLIVDLDGTLVRTDTAFELIAANFTRKPLAVLAALATGLVSRARMKSRLAAAGALDVDTLPLREDLVAYLTEQRRLGREIHLVSAADQAVVDQVAARVGLFDSASGSRDGVNLKGARKAAALVERFPDGFVYAGDSPADGPVWRASAGAIVAGNGKAAERAARAAERAIEATFRDPPTTFKDWRKALRLHQWAKNVLLFVALFLGQAYHDPQAWAACVLGFFILGAVASGTYVVNDLLDLASDRRHPTKRMRMLASGRLRIAHALLLAPVLIVGGLAGGFLVEPLFGASLAAYLALTLAYSLRLKRVPFLDTLLLAWLFTLRILMGGALAGVVVSEWLLVFSMFFFFGLSIAKRHVEVLKRGRDGGGALPGRGFDSQDEAVTLAFGVASSVASILILVMYLMEGAFPSGFYTAPVFLWAMPVVVGGWLTRVWLLAHRGELDDDPVAFAIRDRVSIVLGLLLGAAFLAASLIG